MIRFRLAVLTAIALAPLAPTQTLLADVQPAAANSAASSDPEGFVAWNNLVLFSADDGTHGRELWRSDGTAGGTWMLIDLNPGSFGGLLVGTPLVATPRGIVFFAFDGNGHAVWISDGTAAGTTRVAPIGTIPNGSSNLWSVDGNTIWFVAFSPDHGGELWHTDGTAAGTYEVADINPGLASAISAGTPPTQIAAFGGSCWFAANDGVHGIEPWVTDGTAQGTRMLVDLASGILNSYPKAFLPLGSDVLFGAASSRTPNATSWWRTDGTAAGTHEVGWWEIYVDYPGNYARLGNLVVYAGYGHGFGTEPFVTDGTAAGTLLMYDVMPGPTTSSPQQFVTFNNHVFFVASDNLAGTELWKTDGTTAGTARLLDLYVGMGGSSIGGLRVANNALWFSARGSSAEGVELWTSDGTAAGTRLVADLATGTASSSPRAFASIGSEVWFSALGLTGGREPWHSDGTASGTRAVADLANTRSDSAPAQFRSSGLRGFFEANDGVHGRETWITDGTPAGTQLWRDANPGSSWASTPGMAIDGDILWWTQESTLFQTDLLGQHERTIRSVANVGTQIAIVGGRAFFGAGVQLWTSDGTAAGTMMLRDFAGSLFYPSGPRHFLALGSGVVFFASEGQFSPQGLWISDGTAAGTRLLIPAPIGLGSNAMVQSWTVSTGVMLWVGQLGQSQIWWTDGVATRQIASPPTNSLPAGTGATALGDRLVFAAGDSATGLEPWTSDGTAAGTLPLLDLRVGAVGSAPDSFVAAGGLAFFVADDGVLGRELYATDGTPAGTRLVADLLSGPASSNPSDLAAIGGGELVVFRAYSGAAGTELWCSDGTTAGTRRLTDLWPGAGGADPMSFARHGNALLFAADDGIHGREPFVLPLGAAGAWVVESIGAGCAGASGLPPRAGTNLAPTLAQPTFRFTLDGAASSAPAALLVGFGAGRVEQPVDCILSAVDVFTALSVTMDPTGHGSFAMPILPDPSFVGFELCVQWLVADPGASLFGFLAASDALRIVFGR